MSASHFVVLQLPPQAPHSVYERVGVDLWYRYLSPMAAEDLLFAALVPTLELERNWQGPIKKEKDNYGYAIAVGNSLAAALGHDRSGWGEAIVRGKGVPLLAAGEDARRGQGELDDKEQVHGCVLSQTLRWQVATSPTSHCRLLGTHSSPRRSLPLSFRSSGMASTRRRL